MKSRTTECNNIPDELAIAQMVYRSIQAREEKGQLLANHFGELVRLLVQVRQNFLVKCSDETICGVETFDGYCTRVLHCSRWHIEHLIQASFHARAEKEQTERDWLCEMILDL